MEKVAVNENNFKQSDIEKAANMLSQGKIVAIPTETVYGLAARTDKKTAVARLYSLKGRPLDKPFSIALADSGQAINQYFLTLNPFGYRLIEKFWPGPLTLIYYQKPEGKIGVRIPANFAARNILKQLKTAVYLPSANLSGQKEAVSADEVEDAFNGNIDLIVDGGQPRYKKSSTVIDLTYKPFKILREGVVSERQIASIFIRRRILFVCTANSCRSPVAEYLLRRYLEKEKRAFLQRYEIISAGIAASDRMHPPEYIQKIMKSQEGLDIAEFKANQVTKQMVFSSDYIFTMEDSQKEYIIKQVPSARARVFNLNRFLPFNDREKIPDPIGKDFAFFETVYDRIKKAIVELVDWL
ncbi:MAG: threonylcarbamoyl-AMP synthase [Candidatus Omnitrophica bacterium]|nr:threonylcarbamoyl-AMP synthase [Candidatus Omnitrophota bacterium]MCF7891734.1 threonylcarbamoyl-AMP synthase [Candidatus Omnitrophota bacterium]MCF7896228.1 threonylcarbamoyl-AMP synthase [Candidatus Omnitrophota bacterium]MCF7897523.1 threonylcarbamoyl-AMP synthase [Candidatus Omnitrophota bacterium]MCF7909086.1 threonylcarbamoyl-AMP synthase [Candidatus Omnitrophota bacterium]